MLSKFIALLFLALTVIAIYYKIIAPIEHNNLINVGEQVWLDANLGRTSKDYSNEIIWMHSWIFKSDMLMSTILCLDAVVLIIMLNLYLINFRDFLRKRRDKPFETLTIVEQDKVLSSVYCKSCLSKQPMFFVRELNTEGIKRYQLECKKCKTTSKVRKTKTK